MDVSRGSFGTIDEGSGRFVELLLRSGELLGESLDYHETLQNVCQAAVSTIADICMIDMLDEKRRGVRLLAAAHRVPERSRGLLESAAPFRRSAPGYPPYVGYQVAMDGTPRLVERVDETYLRKHATSLMHERFMLDMGYRSMIVAPLQSVRYGILGAITIVRTDPTEPDYGPAALRFFMDLARRCGSAVSKSMLYEQTLEIAMRFQRAALPKHLPSVPSFNLDAFYEPASAAQLVGGDWYDAFSMDDQRIGITIGDVQGHGVEAAVLMNSLRDALRAAMYAGSSVDGALRIGDWIMTLEGEGRFSTALAAVLDIEHCTLTLASAGHPGPLIWIDAEGRVTDPFFDRSLPLGMKKEFGETQQASTTISLSEGDFALFFTDGLIEWQHDFDGGMHRAEEVLQRRATRCARHPALEIRRLLLTGPTPDDVAILTVRAD